MKVIGSGGAIFPEFQIPAEIDQIIFEYSFPFSRVGIPFVHCQCKTIGYEKVVIHNPRGRRLHDDSNLLRRRICGQRARPRQHGLCRRFERGGLRGARARTDILLLHALGASPQAILCKATSQAPREAPPSPRAREADAGCASRPPSQRAEAECRPVTRRVLRKGSCASRGSGLERPLSLAVPRTRRSAWRQEITRSLQPRHMKFGGGLSTRRPPIFFVLWGAKRTL